MNRIAAAAGSLLAAALVALPLVAGAKLPAPTPEAKAKADEAKNKTAWTDKVAAYKLCQSQDKVASKYMKKQGKDAKPAGSTPPCADPGAYVPLAAASAPPLEAAGAHSPPQTATQPPNAKATHAEQTGAVKK